MSEASNCTYVESGLRPRENWLAQSYALFWFHISDTAADRQVVGDPGAVDVFFVLRAAVH